MLSFSEFRIQREGQATGDALLLTQLDRSALVRRGRGLRCLTLIPWEMVYGGEWGSPPHILSLTPCDLGESTPLLCPSVSSFIKYGIGANDLEGFSPLAYILNLCWRTFYFPKDFQTLPNRIFKPITTTIMAPPPWFICYSHWVPWLRKLARTLGHSSWLFSTMANHISSAT